MGEVQLYVGENLSYEDEKIFVKQARELTDYRGDALSVICAWNPDAKTALTTHGLPDDAFIPWKSTDDQDRGTNSFAGKVMS